MIRFEQLFYRVGLILTSHGIVIIFMLISFTGLTFITHNLYNELFPSDMVGTPRIIATWLGSFTWEFTILMAVCNTHHLGKVTPWILSICTGVFMLIFMEAFDRSQSWGLLLQRFMLASTVTVSSKLYSDLFYKKWLEIQQKLGNDSELLQLRTKVEQLGKQLEQALADLAQRDATVVELKATLHQRDATLAQNARDLEQLSASLKAFEAKMNQLPEYKCGSCGKSFSKESSLVSHKGHCGRDKTIQVSEPMLLKETN